ncbi:MAG: ATP-binding cassette domain-containing protein [Acidobacteria bacterium]|nr:ATP-binding cassette domain-containing protein [Acidobacteriota bacterium]NIM60283.1 ATP-binding cassette domain-containing protein [Acidobacteriota bacterium]NIO57886.1 ATP-binding cassette domain-containing protein [Acidobacteriota bacterium]NIQ28895.1 ATP-binding cassette domain-containing protein [Acidobacteriota bacterium]NIQ83353.1 ATP-binding cassette domain-containing protein [Acidobacteriota bacterium]
MQCKGLVKRYGDVVAVDGLDLEVRRGECFGLLGPNGAGKTTTVEIFEGLLTPDEGDVTVLGERWRGDGRALRNRLGIQLQETRLHEKLTVLETITLFRSFYDYGAAPEKVLKDVGLEEKSGAWVRTLSGGQQQRLSLACALACDPEVLFLDEPTTGLDPQSRRQIWNIVMDLRSRDRTVLLTTHYMDEAERLCDRVAIVDRGKIIALGSPAELIASLGADNVVEITCDRLPDLSRVPGLGDVQEMPGEEAGLRVTVQRLHRAVPDILGALKDQGVELLNLTTHHATLEDLFVALTGRHLRDD